MPYLVLFSEMPWSPRTSVRNWLTIFLHLSHHWIILMATKASHSSSFSAEAYDVGVCWEWWICTHRSFRRNTTLTMLPICLHLDYSSSPLVTLKELKEWDLHATKLSKEHTKHELSAHLSTSPLLVFSSGILQRSLKGGLTDFHHVPINMGYWELLAPFRSWKRWICTHRSPRKDTPSTNLMPICLHRHCWRSPLVSSKKLVELDLH